MCSSISGAGSSTGTFMPLEEGVANRGGGGPIEVGGGENVGNEEGRASERLPEDKEFKRLSNSRIKCLKSKGIDIHELDRLRPAWQQFVEYGRRYDACVEAVIELYEAQGPEVTISPAVLVPIAELNATFDFDLYCLGDGREE